jgi:hypothetical protein
MTSPFGTGTGSGRGRHFTADRHLGAIAMPVQLVCRWNPGVSGSTLFPPPSNPWRAGVLHFARTAVGSIPDRARSDGTVNVREGGKLERWAGNERGGCKLRGRPTGNPTSISGPTGGPMAPRRPPIAASLKRILSLTNGVTKRAWRSACTGAPFARPGIWATPKGGHGRSGLTSECLPHAARDGRPGRPWVSHVTNRSSLAGSSCVHHTACNGTGPVNFGVLPH